MSKVIHLENTKKESIPQSHESHSLSSRRAQDEKFNGGKKKNFFEKINSRINSLSRLQFFSLLLVMIVLGYFGMRSMNINMNIDATTIIPMMKAQSCKDIMDPKCWTDSFFPQLKQKNDLTNALLIGVDTRSSDTGLLNTDTIIVASYNHKDKKTLLISLPRDLYVPYYIDGKGPYYNKINSIYAIGENRKKGEGFNLLKTNIERMLDIEIQYTAKVNFDTVMDTVNAVGGVTVTLDKDYTDIYPKKELPESYQKNCKLVFDNGEYCSFTFKKGENTFDGQNALIYARMRQRSSDFDRAKRQQQIIDAVKNKALHGDQGVLERAKFLWDMYQTVMNKDKVDANATYDDLLAGLALVDRVDMKPLHVVLDPSFGGNDKLFYSSSVPIKDGENTIDMYVLSVRDETFNDVRKELDRVREFPDLYREKASVTIVNQTGKKFDSDSDATKLKTIDPYFGSLNFVTKPKSSEMQIKIFVFDQSKTATIDYLKKHFKTELAYMTPTDFGVAQSGYKEDIQVVINPDFDEE